MEWVSPDQKKAFRDALVGHGFFGSRIHASRASVFSHPDTGDHEFFLKLDETPEVALARLLRERDEIQEQMSQPTLK